MPKEVELDRLKEMLDTDDVQLIEVLPEREYADEHLPGAINIPLKSLNEDTVRALDRAATTVVYCWDDI